MVHDVFPFAVLIRFWLQFQYYGYPGKHGSESSLAASPKIISKNIANTSKPAWRRLETIEIVSRSYRNRIEIVNHQRIEAGRIPEIISVRIVSKSYKKVFLETAVSRHSGRHKCGV